MCSSDIVVSCPVGPAGQRVACTVVGPSSTSGFYMVRHHALVTHVHESDVRAATESELSDHLPAQLLLDDFDLVAEVHGSDAAALAWQDDSVLLLEDGMVEEPVDESPEDDMRMAIDDELDIEMEPEPEPEPELALETEPETEPEPEPETEPTNEAGTSVQCEDVIYIKTVPAACQCSEVEHVMTVYDCIEA